MAHVSSLARRASESSLPQNESKAMHAPDPASDGRATRGGRATAIHGVALSVVRSLVHEEAGLATYVRPVGAGGRGDGVGGRNGSHAARRAGGLSDRRHSGSLPG